MNFYEKISSIESLLGDSKKFKDKTLLATAIYFKVQSAVPYRKIPMNGISFSWYNLRYWMQKLKRNGKLEQIKSIVGGD